MRRDPPLLHDAVLRTLVATGIELSRLTFMASGLEFCVFRASTPRFGEIAVRTPWTRWISNDNDPHLDARMLLAQEAAFLEHVRLQGIPVPAVLACISGAEVDLLITELIRGDGTAPDSLEIGRLAATLHGTSQPAWVPVAQRQLGLVGSLVENLVRRAGVVSRLGGVSLSLPPQDALTDLFANAAKFEALLHMDLRPENLIVRDGKIVALLDWSNALIADPALELARVAEYGGYDERFVEGYGGDLLAERAPALVTAYRLYTAVMLAVVFLSESPDPARSAAAAERAALFAHKLCVDRAE